MGWGLMKNHSLESGVHPCALFLQEVQEFDVYVREVFYTFTVTPQKGSLSKKDCRNRFSIQQLLARIEFSRPERSLLDNSPLSGEKSLPQVNASSPNSPFQPHAVFVAASLRAAPRQSRVLAADCHSTPRGSGPLSMPNQPQASMLNYCIHTANSTATMWFLKLYNCQSLHFPGPV